MRCSRNHSRIRCRFGFRTGPQSRNSHGFFRCNCSYSRIRSPLDKSRTGPQSLNRRGFSRCSRSYSRIRCRFERFRTGPQSRNPRGLLRCGRSYSRIRCRLEILDVEPVPSRETVGGSSAVAAATRGSDAGSKSLDFVPVPSRETIVSSRAVAAATHGFTDPMPVRNPRCRTGPQSRNCRGFLRCGRRCARIRCRLEVLDSVPVPSRETL